MAEAATVSSVLLRAARTAPTLTVDEERDLVVRYRGGDLIALGTLVIVNVRLAVSRARRLRGYGLPEEDLVQEGIVGLLEAATRFDVERDVRFSAYAGWWIKALTNDYVLRNWSIVRTALSGEQKRLFFNIRGIRARLSRDPSVATAALREAIAAAAGVPLREVEIMEARLGGDVALNAPAGWDEDGETEVGDSIPDDGPLPDELTSHLIDDDERERALKTALGTLDDRERLIVQERWLTDDVAPLEALAEWFGITRDRVKRIEIGAIAKLSLAVGQNVAA